MGSLREFGPEFGADVPGTDRCIHVHELPDLFWIFSRTHLPHHQLRLQPKVRSDRCCIQRYLPQAKESMTQLLCCHFAGSL